MFRFVVIGLGSIAKRHIRNLKSLYECSAVYVMSASGRVPDVLPEGVEGVLKAIEDVLDLKPTLVIVASPATFHKTHVKQLIENGIPVLIEKPIAASYKEAKEIYDLAVVHKKSFVTVGYCLRFLPAAQIVKSFIDSGELGEIYNINAEVGQYLPSWRSDKNYTDSVSARKELGGGVLLEISHEFDYLNWFFGKLEPIYAKLRNSKELNLKVEDIADIVFETQTGALCYVHLDFLQKTARRNMSVTGRNGRLTWDVIANNVKYEDSEKITLLYEDKNYDKNSMYLNQLNESFACIASGIPPQVSVLSSVVVLELIEKVRLLAGVSL